MERRTFFEFLFKYGSFENLLIKNQKIKFKFRRVRFFFCNYLLSFKISLFYVEIDLYVKLFDIKKAFKKLEL